MKKKRNSLHSCIIWPYRNAMHSMHNLFWFVHCTNVHIAQMCTLHKCAHRTNQNKLSLAALSNFHPWANTKETFCWRPQQSCKLSEQLILGHLPNKWLRSGTRPKPQYQRSWEIILHIVISTAKRCSYNHPAQRFPSNPYPSNPTYSSRAEKRTDRARRSTRSTKKTKTKSAVLPTSLMSF